MAEHWRAGVARAAERTSGNGLQAIEELEGCAGGEQQDSGVNDRLVGRVHPRDGPRKTSSAMLAAIMKVAPRKIAVSPASEAPDGSLRPMAWPTRTAAAEEITSGTM